VSAPLSGSTRYWVRFPSVLRLSKTNPIHHPIQGKVLQAERLAPAGLSLEPGQSVALPTAAFRGVTLVSP